MVRRLAPCQTKQSFWFLLLEWYKWRNSLPGQTQTQSHVHWSRCASWWWCWRHKGLFFHIQMGWNFKVLDISTISLFLERILMGHIEPIYNLESKLWIGSICPIQFVLEVEENDCISRLYVKSFLSECVKKLSSKTLHKSRILQFEKSHHILDASLCPWFLSWNGWSWYPTSWSCGEYSI